MLLLAAVVVDSVKYGTAYVRRPFGLWPERCVGGERLLRRRASGGHDVINDVMNTI